MEMRDAVLSRSTEKRRNTPYNEESRLYLALVDLVPKIRPLPSDTKDNWTHETYNHIADMEGF